jgi:hypothetical protein
VGNKILNSQRMKEIRVGNGKRKRTAGKSKDVQQLWQDLEHCVNGTALRKTAQIIKLTLHGRIEYIQDFAIANVIIALALASVHSAALGTQSLKGQTSLRNNAPRGVFLG